MATTRELSEEIGNYLSSFNDIEAFKKNYDKNGNFRLESYLDFEIVNTPKENNRRYFELESVEQAYTILENLTINTDKDKIKTGVDLNVIANHVNFSQPVYISLWFL